MKKEIILPKEMSCDLAEEIGLHLGDGSMNYYSGKGFYQLRGHIEDDKLHYILRIKSLYKKLFDVDVHLRDMPSTGVYGFQIWSDELIGYKHKILGLPLGPKHDFLVPSIVADNDDFSRSFLRGLFDTDGCIYLEHKNGKLYPRIEIVSVCENFMQQIHVILLRLGFRATFVTTDYAGCGRQNIHKVSIRGIDMTQKWFTEIQSNNPKHVNKFKRLNLES